MSTEESCGLKRLLSGQFLIHFAVFSQAKSQIKDTFLILFCSDNFFSVCRQLLLFG